MAGLVLFAGSAMAASVLTVKEKAEVKGGPEAANHPGVGRATDIPEIRLMPLGRYPCLGYHSVVGDELVVVLVRHGAREAPEPEDFL